MAVLLLNVATLATILLWKYSTRCHCKGLLIKLYEGENMLADKVTEGSLVC